MSRTKTRIIISIISVFLVCIVPAFSQVSISGTVVSVEDGSSFIVKTNSLRVRIQLKGVEAPLNNHPLFELTKSHLENFILDKSIVIRTEHPLDDPIVGETIINNVNLSLQLIRDGAGWFNSDPFSENQRLLFVEMESLAKSEKRGVWGYDIESPSLMAKKFNEMVRLSSDPLQDIAVIQSARSFYGPDLDDVFGSEIFSTETGNCSGRIVGISDGDTVTILNSNNQTIKVRLEGIDAPEKSQSCGMRSKQFLSNLIFNKTVSCDARKKDRYGRTIGKISFNGQDVNKTMIASGFAWHYKQYASEQIPSDRASYAASEAAARLGGSGIWSSECDQTPPWDYRKKRFEASLPGQNNGGRIGLDSFDVFTRTGQIPVGAKESTIDTNGGQTYDHVGPRGGVYRINSHGNKVYRSSERRKH